jgi:antitoxin Phd
MIFIRNLDYCCYRFYGSKKNVVVMMLNSNQLVSMTEANQNFSKVVRLVDERGMAVIMKNNKPRYIVLSFSEYNEIQAVRQKLISEAVDEVIAENIEALTELAK